MLNKFCRASIPNVLGHGNFSSCCGDLKSMVKRRIQYEQDRVKKLKKTHGNCKVGDVTVNMVFGGLRGMKGLVCETSSVDPNAGITFRGKSIEDCQNLLPRAPGCSQPLPEGLFFLMLTGTVPNQEQVKSVSVEWAIRSQIPDHIFKLLDTFPTSMHPMTQLSSAMTALNTESQFAKRYGTLKKSEHWEVIYEDCMDVIAKVPVIAATIYRNTYKKGVPVVCGEIDVDRDWACNFCRMLGYSDPAFIELMRLYICIHCDHEGGNVSVHTARVVGSALSDPYLSYAAGMNGLAGPLHGLANQEVLEWLKQMQKELGKNYTEQTLKDFITKTLKSGKVVPGYGHAVLRKTDPRYNCLKNFAQTHLPKDPMVKLVADVNKVVPPILESLGKVQNPWANVDAHSGVVLYPYMKETSYYTVLFGVARTLGIMANIIWDRGLGLPIERPSSKNIDGYIKLLGIDTRCDSEWQ